MHIETLAFIYEYHLLTSKHQAIHPQFPLLHHLLPFLNWWPLVTRTTARADFIAGLIGALVVLPQGLAFATLAGMPPQYGLYCAMVPAVLAALFGSSLHTVTGPTNAVSMIVFATIAPLAVPESDRYVALVLTLAFMSGLMMLIAGGLRLGSFVRLVPHSVVVGFTSAVGVLIFANQLAALTGVPLPRGDSLFGLLTKFLKGLPQLQAWVFATGIATIAASVACRRFFPKFPHMIAAMLAGSAAALVFNLTVGSSVTQIKMVGAIATGGSGWLAGLPPLSLPSFDLAVWRQLLGIAAAVTLLSLVEAVSIGRAVALKSGQQLNGNQEFIGQGLANLSAAFFSGYPCSASFNRSGLNYESGAKTPLAAIFSALLLIVILTFVADLGAYLPLATTAGILILVAIGLLHVDEVIEILRGDRWEAAVFSVTFIATLAVNLEIAIALGLVAAWWIHLLKKYWRRGAS